MDNKFIRTQMLLGSDAMNKLKNSHVAVFGIGGVGGYTVEALVRSGIGSIDIIDSDTVDESNINRQIYATVSTIGQYKTDVAKKRILDINPDINVTAHRIFYTPETEHLFDFSKYDYIADAIDTVTGKIALAVNAEKAGTPIISSMGAGNKLCPEMFEVADIYQTSICPLARVMRHELKKRNIKSLKVVYSKETARTPLQIDGAAANSGGKPVPASSAFVPSVVGLIMASQIIKDITGCE